MSAEAIGEGTVGRHPIDEHAGPAGGRCPEQATDDSEMVDLACASSMTSRLATTVPLAANGTWLNARYEASPRLSCLISRKYSLSAASGDRARSLHSLREWSTSTGFFP